MGSLVKYAFNIVECFLKILVLLKWHIPSHEFQKGLASSRQVGNEPAHISITTLKPYELPYVCGGQEFYDRLYFCDFNPSVADHNLRILSEVTPKAQFS